MADVFLTSNGIGCGHLVRAIRICGWFRRRHRRPVIFHQGKYPPQFALRYPGVDVPTIYELPDEDIRDVENLIADVALLSRPSLVIEDTHPSLIKLPALIDRFLIVRPTVMEHMRWLQYNYGKTYSRMIVCDDRRSPTWPYSASETQELMASGCFDFIGPIFRRAATRGMARVRAKYRLGENDKLVVFSLGGGGEKQGTFDRAVFLERAASIAEQLLSKRVRRRLMLVCGPLFPKGIEIPRIFEVIEEEPDLPSLFAVAEFAVIRPGYNSIWECIAAGTPFIPLQGTTYMEPVAQRLDQMERHGLVTPRDGVLPDDINWHGKFKAASEIASKQFSGDPSDNLFMAINSSVSETNNGTTSITWSDRSTAFIEMVDDSEAPKAPLTRELFIRMDDVVEPCVAIEWLSEICVAGGLFASLEIIPYLSKLSLKLLDHLDPEGVLETSQHGYAHLPHSALGTPESEFALDPQGYSSLSAVNIRRGIRLMRYKYAGRFQGTFSPPYGFLPDWLPAYWLSIGGRGFSLTPQHKLLGNIPHKTFKIRTWNSFSNSLRDTSEIIAETECAIEADGEVGVILRPSCATVASDWKKLERIFEIACSLGCRGCRLSDCVAHQIE